MTPEAELLLQCARRHPDADAIRALANAASNWPAFASMADTHDLKSLAFRRLQQLCPEAVPAEIFGHLQQHFRRNSERNLFMTRELFRVLDALDSGGIPAAAFKGPVFAWSLYETPGAREFMDLDLLVHTEHINPAQHLLRELGYRPEADRQFFQYGGQLELIRDAPPTVLDLHWNLAPNSMGLMLDAETLWPRLTQTPIAGRPVLTFDPNDQLVLSALHGGKHGWTTLAWLADIDAIVETNRLDWPRVLTISQHNRLSRALFLALRLAGDLLKTAIPVDVMEKVSADSACTALARDATSYLIDGPGNQPLIPRKVAYQLRLTEGGLRRWQMLWRKLTEPNIADAGSLNIRRSPFWLYYATRPCRLAVKYVRLATRRLAKK